MQHNYQQLSRSGRVIGLMCLCVCRVTLMAFNLDMLVQLDPYGSSLKVKDHDTVKSSVEFCVLKWWAWLAPVSWCCCSCVHISLLTSVIEDVASQYRATAVVLCLSRSVDVGDGVRKTRHHDAAVEQAAWRWKRALQGCTVVSRPTYHYFHSVCWFVCLFVCAEFFSAVFDPISIKLGHNMLYVWV